jgi:hypothetical protein
MIPGARARILTTALDVERVTIAVSPSPMTGTLPPRRSSRAGCQHFGKRDQPGIRKASRAADTAKPLMKAIL